jgi:hypothetical protein
MSRIVDEESALSDLERESLARDTEALKRWDPVRLQKWIAESKRRYGRLKSGEDSGLTLEEFWDDDETAD